MATMDIIQLKVRTTGQQPWRPEFLVFPLGFFQYRERYTRNINAAALLWINCLRVDLLPISWMLEAVQMRTR